MRAKEAAAKFRILAVLHQWSGGKCGICSAAAPDHLRACGLADALEATALKDACPRCFADPMFSHAPQCPKAAKA